MCSKSCFRPLATHIILQRQQTNRSAYQGATGVSCRLLRPVRPVRPPRSPITKSNATDSLMLVIWPVPLSHQCMVAIIRVATIAHVVGSRDISFHTPQQCNAPSHADCWLLRSPIMRHRRRQICLLCFLAPYPFPLTGCTDDSMWASFCNIKHVLSYQISLNLNFPSI